MRHVIVAFFKAGFVDFRRWVRIVPPITPLDVGA
jgi:hypothetical protein